MSVPTELLGALGRLGVDVLAMLLLVGWLYRRRIAAPEMALVFTALNIGLFAAITTIGSGDFPTGIGFGLFGLLQPGPAAQRGLHAQGRRLHVRGAGAGAGQRAAGARPGW